MNYRLYSFVANHYLSPLQCGLQTAHVVGELAHRSNNIEPYIFHIFNEWSSKDKTIIICAAGNQAGVLNAFDELATMQAAIELPIGLFREDEQSMNGMATACGIIVPEKIWGAEMLVDNEDNEVPYVFYTDTGFIALSAEETVVHRFLKYFKLA